MRTGITRTRRRRAPRRRHRQPLLAGIAVTHLKIGNVWFGCPEERGADERTASVTADPAEVTCPTCLKMAVHLGGKGVPRFREVAKQHGPAIAAERKRREEHGRAKAAERKKEAERKKAAESRGGRPGSAEG